MDATEIYHKKYDEVWQETGDRLLSQALASEARRKYLKKQNKVK